MTTWLDRPLLNGGAPMSPAIPTKKAGVTAAPTTMSANGRDNSVRRDVHFSKSAGRAITAPQIIANQMMAPATPLTNPNEAVRQKSKDGALHTRARIQTAAIKAVAQASSG